MRGSSLAASMVLLVLAAAHVAEAPAAGGAERPALRATPGDVVPPMAQPKLLRNGDFDAQLAGWTILLADGADAALDILQTDAGPVLRVVNRNDRPLRLVSERLTVQGARYQFTGLLSRRDKGLMMPLCSPLPAAKMVCVLG